MLILKAPECREAKRKAAQREECLECWDDIITKFLQNNNDNCKFKSKSVFLDCVQASLR